MHYFKLNEYLKNKEIKDEDFLTEVDVLNNKIFLNKDQLIKGAIERLGSEDKIIEIFEHMIKRHEKTFFEYKKGEYKKDFVDFIVDMGIHTAFKGVVESSWDKYCQNYDYDKDFIIWWAKENKISNQQMFCEHDDQDQFSSDGQWYNYVGECRKMLT